MTCTVAIRYSEIHFDESVNSIPNYLVSNLKQKLSKLSYVPKKKLAHNHIISININSIDYMKLSKRGEYALRALIDLGIAQEVGRPLLQLPEIAEKERLPQKFLEQIVQSLRDIGLVESARGRLGGYRLARPSSKISVGEVVRAIDGPLAPIGCVSQTAFEKCSCPDENHCGLRMVMLDVRNAITSILDRYTIADVVVVTLRKMQRNGLPLPFTEPPLRIRTNGARAAYRVESGRNLQPEEGLITNLLGDYSI